LQAALQQPLHLVLHLALWPVHLLAQLCLLACCLPV
jgi:hypothetical protein